MKRRRITTLVAVVAIAVAACGGATATVELVDAPEASELLAAPPDGLVVLDVRTPEEFVSGHIGDPINIDFYDADFSAQLDELTKDTPYFVYCRSGNRSGQTVEIMRELGFTEVYELDGGIGAWAQAGLPFDG